MLARLKNFFSGETNSPVETYGKLPCYKDYISVVLTPGAAQWRAWLLESFQGTIIPPEGIWRFIYQHQKNADPVVGVITASSDGIRQFPFTLFTVCSRGRTQGGLCFQSRAFSIWRELEELYRQLATSEDIQGFYARLQGRKISPSTEKEMPVIEDQEFWCNREGDYPRLLIAGPRDSGTLHLIKDGKTSNEELARNWSQVSEAMRSGL